MTASLKAYAALAAVLLMLLAAALGYWAGESREHDRRVAEVATLHRAWAEASAKAALADQKKLASAQALGDALTGKVLQLENSLSLKAQELEREINRRTHGRACLDSGLVRVLNAAADPDTGGRVPEAASSAAAADGAAASDRDVALWIDRAREQYDTCRARLGALIDFENGVPR